jgi:hypothetical protein
MLTYIVHDLLGLMIDESRQRVEINVSIAMQPEAGMPILNTLRSLIVRVDGVPIVITTNAPSM